MGYLIAVGIFYFGMCGLACYLLFKQDKQYVESFDQDDDASD